MSNLKVAHNRVTNLQISLKQLLSKKRPSATEKLVKPIELNQQIIIFVNMQI